jgi:type IV secretion system protein TrbE
MKTDDSFASQLPYGSFTPEGEVYLRGKGLMVGFELRGLPLEASSPAQRAAACQRLVEAIRHLGSGYMLQVVSHRLPHLAYPAREFPSAAAGLIDGERRGQFEAENYWRTLSRLYITMQMESPGRSRVHSAMFGSGQWDPSPGLVLARFRERLANFRDALGGTIELRRLTNEETFRDLILCVSGRDFPAIVPRGPVRLNEVIACERFYGGVAPWAGELHLRPVCITGYPAETAPQMLAVLLRQPGLLTVSARFITLDPVDAQDQLELERIFWVREAQGSIMDMALRAMKIERRKTLHADAEQQVAEVDAAMAEAAAGMPFGWCTITAVVKDTDPERATARARGLVKDLSAIGLMARVEDANAVEAAQGAWPGDGWSNVRRPMLTAGNFAELILPVEHWPGTQFVDSPFYEKETPVPLACGGSGKEPFYPPTHLGGVANQLMIGPTGAGKSAALGTMAVSATGLPDAQIVWLDLDYSSFVLAHALGATYIELAADNSSPLSPLRHLDDENGVGWSFDWFTRLFARWDISLDEVQAADLISALDLAKAQGIRNLGIFATLIQDPRLRGVLANYANGGKWAHIFDGEAISPPARGGAVTVYEMRGLVALGERAAAPATELILHGAETAMGAHPAFIYVDEAWRMLSDKVSAEWLFDAIRTFRKRNAGITLATQSLTEIANSAYRDLLLESCPGKIFLPNAEARGAYVKEAYFKLGLSETEIEIVASAAPRREYFFHSPAGRRLFTLNLGPLALRLCAATGSRDVEAARALLQAYGPERFLDAWLGKLPAHTNGRVHEDADSYRNLRAVAD